MCLALSENFYLVTIFRFAPDLFEVPICALLSYFWYTIIWTLERTGYNERLRISLAYTAVGMILMLLHIGLDIYFLANYSGIEAIEDLYFSNIFIYLLGAFLLLFQSQAFVKKMQANNTNMLLMKDMSFNTTCLLVSSLIFVSIYYCVWLYRYYALDKNSFKDLDDMPFYL
mmetsp:Transcript_29420/g.52667  ORF Transcript_29420/g.52667 Transcript_29420/m.52667 type:complete len:171 (+) Transcript_29420:166-678(+)